MFEQADRNTTAAQTMAEPSTPTAILSPQILRPQNFHVWNSNAQHAGHGYSRQRSVAISHVV